jgi:hypothetical protein
MEPPTAIGINMPEPASSSLLGAATIYKVFGIGAALSYTCVMAMSWPKTYAEAFTACISTVLSSVCGGAYVIMHFGLQSWAFDPLGMGALIGISFLCGLPAWFLVRAVFIFFEENKDKDIVDLVNDTRNSLKGKSE